jgi:hypothetical protein
MSDKIVFEDFGLQIVAKDGHYYAVYDSGESVGGYEKRRKLTNAQANRAMISEDEAYKVLLEVDDE